MKRALMAAVALVLALSTSVAAVQGPTLPWKLFSEQAKDGVEANMTMCGPQKEVLVARFVAGGDAYMSFWGVESGQYVILYYKGNVAGAPPDAVGFGKVDPAKHDSIPTLRWLTLDEAKSKFPSLCDALYPQTT